MSFENFPKLLNRAYLIYRFYFVFASYYSYERLIGRTCHTLRKKFVKFKSVGQENACCITEDSLEPLVPSGESSFNDSPGRFKNVSLKTEQRKISSEITSITTSIHETRFLKRFQDFCTSLHCNSLEIDGRALFPILNRVKTDIIPSSLLLVLLEPFLPNLSFKIPKLLWFTALSNLITAKD